MAVLSIPHEREFRLEELFFSTTDRQGRILSGNEVFARISGYSYAELIGQPHNIIRHPDMPRAVFKLLWDYLLADKSITAYVKNRAKDGSYYWVVAMVVPVAGGFLSVRFKPSSEFFPLVQAVYKQLLATENAQPGKAGMEAAGAQLGDILATKGLPSYDAFMHAFLREEVRSRTQLLARQSRTLESDVRGDAWDPFFHQWAIAREVLDALFALLDDFANLNRNLEGNADFIAQLALSMRRLSLNASIESVHLEGEGNTMGVLAQFLGENSCRIEQVVAVMHRRLHSLITDVHRVIYDLSSSKLMLEMLAFFGKELRRRGASIGSKETQSSEGKIHDLRDALRTTAGGLLSRLLDTRNALGTLTAMGEELNGNILTLQFIQLNGRIEAARLRQAAQLAVILQDILHNVETTKERLQDLRSSVTTVQNKMGQLETSQATIFTALDSMCA